jgi:propionyl-CoA synthetase
VFLVVSKLGTRILKEIIEKHLITLIWKKIVAVGYYRNAIVIKRLPKTRSGKNAKKNTLTYCRWLALQYPIFY